jgi:hypothetical protein
MEIREESNQPDWREQGHNRWLAMQSAYAEYIRATEALEDFRKFPESFNLEPGADPVEAKRDAFERYLEARIEFLELRFDEISQRGSRPAKQPLHDTVYSAIGARIGTLKWLLPVVAIGILTFALVREQKHVRQLETARDEAQAALMKTGEGLQLLVKKLDARLPPERSPIHQINGTVQPLRPAVQRRIAPRTTSPATGGRRYYSFSLSRSPQFKQIGPIEVSLRSVDVRRNSVSVTIVSASGKLDVQGLTLNQPLRIINDSRGQPLEFVVDRIAPNGVSGHLVGVRG